MFLVILGAIGLTVSGADIQPGARADTTNAALAQLSTAGGVDLGPLQTDVFAPMQEPTDAMARHIASGYAYETAVGLFPLAAAAE